MPALAVKVSQHSTPVKRVLTARFAFLPVAARASAERAAAAGRLALTTAGYYDNANACSAWVSSLQAIHGVGSDKSKGDRVVTPLQGVTTHES